MFVYGTLLAGEDNHEELSGALWVRPARTRRCYTLVDQGAWPGLTVGGTQAVFGQLYAVDAALRADLDAFEECQEVFVRRHVRLACSTMAEAYFLQARHARGAPPLRPPCWPVHAAARRRP